jgi:predicted nucleic acid-binding protein
MLEVISNTSPLQYLYQCDKLDLLRAMYGAVVVPASVVDEVEEGRKRGIPLPDLRTLKWVKIETSGHIKRLPLASDLGAGELEVLLLAADKMNALVILDDGLARQYARFHGIRFTGTCGILLKAKQQRLIMAVLPLLDKLAEFGFFLDERTRAAILRLAGE